MACWGAWRAEQRDPGWWSLTDVLGPFWRRGRVISEEAWFGLNVGHGLVSGFWKLDLRNVCDIKFRKLVVGYRR